MVIYFLPLSRGRRGGGRPNGGKWPKEKRKGGKKEEQKTGRNGRRGRGGDRITAEVECIDWGGVSEMPFP